VDGSRVRLVKQNRQPELELDERHKSKVFGGRHSRMSREAIFGPTHPSGRHTGGGKIDPLFYVQ
jgi:hypothetical protein